MVSGPRNISTTMMRAFENRPDACIIDEPFYAAYLAKSGADHPYRDETLAAMPTSPDAVVRWIDGLATAPIQFEKHIAYHIEADAPLAWLARRKVFILVRDPRAMIASYAEKLPDVAPILDSARVQRRILADCEARGAPCPVVDAADILRDPPATLAALCVAIDIPFREEMLAWPAGPRAGDGPWAPHWYDAVIASTGFRPFVDRKIVLAPALETLADTARADYEFFHRRRLRA